MSCDERESSPPRDADNPHTTSSGSNDVATRESNSRASIEERLASKMFSYAREIICFFLAITFTALAALHSSFKNVRSILFIWFVLILVNIIYYINTSPPKISKPPPAKPFFDQSSVVLDFYKGHLDAMIERVTEADFSFVMYYAPWDAESQAVRQEFEKVAQYYNNQIFFAAINCWHPNSECKTQYNKIQSYPVLMLYPSRDSGIQYRGIRTAPYMIRFLNAFIHPIVRITHKEEIVELLVEHDAVVIGFFNFTQSSKSPGYKEFYKAAVRSLERDPNREVIFAIVTNTISSELNFGIVQFPSAALIMWNESLSYPEENLWNTENILNWISSSLHQPALWLQPPGIKALTLAPYLREGPVLFLFTPRNPLHNENYNYNLMREIGMQYYNCADNLFVRNLIAHLKLTRHTGLQRHTRRSKECRKLLEVDNVQENESKLSVTVQQWINESCCAKIVMNKCQICTEKETLDKEISVCTLASEQSDSVCKNVDVFKVSSLENKHEKYDYCCNKNHITKLHNERKFNSVNYKMSNKKDPRSASEVRKFFAREKCRKWLHGDNYQQPIVPRDSYKHPNVTITDSVCKTNKTLALVAIDSLYYFHFAEGLGIDVLNKKDKTAVVILDAVQESQYVMKEDFSRYALVHFINNYTRGYIQRTLRSDNTRRFAQKFKTEYTCEKKESSICIPELTTETFMETVLDPAKDVVVMYHSSYCGFCSAISYIYLSVAYYLSQMDHLLFVRIDGDNNDLPWEYNMNRFPSILFFPAKRKEDSTVYPFSLPITIPNLLNFILANLKADSHVEALVNICQHKIGDPPDKCVARIRWLCLDIIEQLLKEYRRLRRHLSFLHKRIARNKRKLILLKLGHIKDIHLILGSTTDLSEDQHKVQTIRRKFKKYYKLISLIELDSQININETKSMSDKSKVNMIQRRIVKTEL